MTIDLQQPVVPLSLTITIVSHDGLINKTIIHPRVHNFIMDVEPINQQRLRRPSGDFIVREPNRGSDVAMRFRSLPDHNGVDTIISNNLIAKPDLELLIPSFSTEERLRMAAAYVEKTVDRKEELLRELSEFGDKVLLDFLQARGYSMVEETEEDDEG